MKKGQHLNSTNLLTQFKGKEIPQKKVINFLYRNLTVTIELEVINNVLPTLSVIQGKNGVSTCFPVEFWKNYGAIHYTALRLLRSMKPQKS